MSRPWEPGTDIAVRHDLAVQLRVPILTSPHPRWRYVVGIVVDDLWNGHPPTGDEIRAIGSFAEEYRVRWYNETWIARMAEFAPYDIDGGANSVYFTKYHHGGWAYERYSWRHGAVPGSSEPPMSLLAVMDRCHEFGGEPNPRWEAWKAEHPDVFAPLTEPAR